MSPERTTQAHHSQTSSTRESPAPATTRRSQHQYQQQYSPHDPTNTAYLTFHLQSVADRQNPADADRRRAETITSSAAAAAASSSSSSASIASSMLSRSGTTRTVTVTSVEVPPNVIPPRPTKAMMMSTAGAGRLSVSPTTTHPDWPMAGSPAVAGSSSRQHHQHHLHQQQHHQQQQHHHHHVPHRPHHSHRVSSVPTARPQSVEDDQDDMVLG